MSERELGDRRVVKAADRLGSVLRNVAAAVAGALIVGALLLGVGLLEQKTAHQRDCEEIEMVKTGLRETLEESKRFAESSPVRSASEKEASTTFYRDALGRLKPRHC